MSSNRWVSLPVLVGGGLIALVVSVWGILFWHMPIWFIYLIAFPFVLLAANFHNRFVFLGLWAVFTIVHTVINIGFDTEIGLLKAETGQWASLLFAGWMIYFLARERRSNEAISQRRIRELEVMNQTLTGISSELELNKLLQVIVEQAVRLLGVSLGELLLLDRKTGELIIVARYPLDKSHIGLKMKPGEGAMGRVAVTKKPLILNDYKAFVNSLADDVTSGVESTMDIPLLKGNDLISVLGVARHDKRQNFTEDDLRLLGVFANQTVIAIENARLYEEVQRMAFTDSLTEINNRRRLFELAESEFKRAQRYGRPLSIMLIDLDHFKSINDLYGHGAGDATLRWFADICQITTRQKIDIVGRFGGEEFAILYPETKLSSAIDAAKRLQHQVTKNSLFIGVTELHITFSAGIVSLQVNESITLDQLIERADKAMYAAKQKRNCLAYWDDRESRPYLLD